MNDSARKDRRYKTGAMLHVRCSSWADFVQLYAADVSQGGVFIVTDDPPEVLSEVDVRMALPEAQEMILRGQVVHVLNAAMADAEGRQPGVGVEFKNITPEMKAQINQLIDYARWEGASGDPSTSYANRLFETARHQKVSRVLSSIPAQRGSSKPPDHGKSTAPERKRATARVQKTERTESRPVNPPADRRRARGARTTEGSRAGALPSNPDLSRAGALPSNPDLSQAGQLPSNPDMSLASNFPSDPLRLKEAMRLIARKNYVEAVSVLEAMIAETPQDVNARKWLHLTQARHHMAEKRADAGIAAYKQALEIDENNREAREAVRNHTRNSRLAGLPFGRYFMKKK